MIGMVHYMSNDRILFCTGEGIGNVVQTIPVIRTLKEVLGYKLDMWHAFGSFKVPNIIPYVDDWFFGKQIASVDRRRYAGLVSTGWTIPYVGRLALDRLAVSPPLTMYRSEVDTYMDIARKLGVREKDLIWHGNCSYEPTKDAFDVVLHDGYNPYGTAKWGVKSYSHYRDLVKKLIKHGLSVCSVGSPKEYIKRTNNRTDLDLPDTLGLIANSKLFIGNDSGLYHCANALEIPNVVIFTATSTVKNYDPRFHKYSTIVGREDLTCRKTCQIDKTWKKRCETWACRDIDPKLVYKTAIRVLEHPEDHIYSEPPEPEPVVELHPQVEVSNENIEDVIDMPETSGWFRKMWSKMSGRSK